MAAQANPQRLVSNAEALAHLRATADDVDENDLAGLIEAASGRVLDFIDDRGLLRYQTETAGTFDALDEDGMWIAPPQVKQATKLLIGYLHRQRDEDETSEFADGELPRPVRALLRAFRIEVV